MANMIEKDQQGMLSDDDLDLLEKSLETSLNQANLSGVALPPLQSFQEARRNYLRRPQAKTKSKGSYHHGNLRESLISITMAQAEEKGIAQVSLRSIAREAGVSAPAMYRHFADKDALMVAVAEQGFHELRDWLRFAAPSEIPFKLRLPRFCMAYLNFMTEYALYFQLMFGLEIKHRHGYPRLAQAYEEIMALWADLVISGRQMGALRIDTPAEDQVLHLATTLHGFSNFCVLGMLEKDQLEALLKHLLASLLSGLGPDTTELT